MRRDTHTGLHTTLTPEEAQGCGMAIAVVAREHPERLAIASPSGDRSFDALNARVNQLVRSLRARGLRAGDPVALICSNRPEFAVSFFAAQRAGWRLTPIPTNLAAGEMQYILENCEAKALLADASHRAPVETVLRKAASSTTDRPKGLAIGGAIHGLESFDDVLAEQSSDDIEDPVLGTQMLYTSGTTGRPKGVHRTRGATRRLGLERLLDRVGYVPGRDLHLLTGPLYHAAPLVFSLVIPLHLGCGVVMMEYWHDSHALELIEGYRITHTHMVPVMFRRLLALPDEERAGRDLSSLKMVLHGAAPCPVSVKRAMMDWLGPVLWEYYAATEGWGCLVSPEEWMERPASVGRPEVEHVRILDDEGKVMPPGTPGKVFLRADDEGSFDYYGDPEKTRKLRVGGYYTLGDVGYLDSEGYLFLIDRDADVIIRGGVNIYPAEVDAVLVSHPSVMDAATVGMPDDEWGEGVVSVVALHDGVDACEETVQALRDHCESQLAHYKCPARIDFDRELPRTETGKIARRIVRDRYWEGRRHPI